MPTKKTRRKPPSLIADLRAALEADPRSVHAIALEVEVAPSALYRFRDGLAGISLALADRLAAALGLRLRAK